VDVNAPEPDGTTALHWAVQRNDIDLVTRLIRAGAKVNVKNDFGSTPMAEAAVVGSAALLEGAPRSRCGRRVAERRRPDCVDGHRANQPGGRGAPLDPARGERECGGEVARTDRPDVGGCPAAARDGARAVAHGADVNARSMVNDWQRQVTAEPRAIYRPAGGLTPLLYAAREGCVECARALVEKGADLSVADPRGSVRC
jgi:ankyrin repeat protein